MLGDVEASIVSLMALDKGYLARGEKPSRFYRAASESGPAGDSGRNEEAVSRGNGTDALTAC